MVFTPKGEIGLTVLTPKGEMGLTVLIPPKGLMGLMVVILVVDPLILDPPIKELVGKNWWLLETRATMRAMRTMTFILFIDSNPSTPHLNIGE